MYYGETRMLFQIMESSLVARCLSEWDESVVPRTILDAHDTGEKRWRFCEAYFQTCLALHQEGLRSKTHAVPGKYPPIQYLVELDCEFALGIILLLSVELLLIY